MDEKNLISRVRSGDAEAFDELISPYKKRVYNIALSLLCNTHDAEEAAQETFIRVYKYLKLFSGSSSFYTWLYKITKNVCYDMIKKRSRAEKHVPLFDEEGTPIDIPDISPSPEEIAIKNDVSLKVQRCITQLKSDFATVLILRDIDGLSYEEIAKVLKISEGTVKSRISRAREKFKEKILSDFSELLDV